MKLAGLGLAVSAFAALTAFATQPPWEPTLSVGSENVSIHRIRAAATVSDSLSVLAAEDCAARAEGLVVRWSGRCAFLQAVYTATLRAPKDRGEIRVAFPFALHRSAGGYALLQDEAEVLSP